MRYPVSDFLGFGRLKEIKVDSDGSYATVVAGRDGEFSEFSVPVGRAAFDLRIGEFVQVRFRLESGEREVAGHPHPRIVCLCGSTRFMDCFHEASWQETMAGRIVLSVGCSKHLHGAEAMAPEVAARLDELHLRKIEMSDEILVLNVGGYVGESTRREIDHATKLGKPVRWLEPQHAKEESRS